MTSRRRWAVAWAAVGAVLAGAATRATAHEIGTTRVTIAFDARDRYRVEIVTDAASLVEKLEGRAGGPGSRSTTAVELAGALERLRDIFGERVTLAFDGAAVTPAISMAVAAADATSAPIATITLSGAVPPQAKALSWKYAWTFASYGLTVRASAADAGTTEWLEGGQTSRPFALNAPTATPSRVAAFAQYLRLGFTHILPGGTDHVLFVLGLFLLSRRAKPLLMQVSAFTLAHSITLGLSIYQVVRLPPSIVEPLIAVSIAYVAIENLLVTDLTRWRVALVFAFGLLHGLGFAGALGEIGLPRAEFAPALVGFNLGVEAGQLTVIAAALAAVGWRWSDRDWYRRAIVVPASTAIAGVAFFWTIQRLS